MENFSHVNNAEGLLFEVLKQNPKLSLNYNKKFENWTLIGDEFREVVLPKGLADLGYFSSSSGIYRKSNGKFEYLAMYCIE